MHNNFGHKCIAMNKPMVKPDVYAWLSLVHCSELAFHCCFYTID